jgi:hypothetical protein
MAIMAMSDHDLSDKVRPPQPGSWSADAEACHADIRTPNTGFTNAAQWGLASLVIGCTLLLAACIILAFNVLLFRGGPAGIPVGLAFMGGLIGTAALSALGLASFLFGVYGWGQPRRSGGVADRGHRLADDPLFVLPPLARCCIEPALDNDRRRQA